MENIKDNTFPPLLKMENIDATKIVTIYTTLNAKLMSKKTSRN